MLHTTAAQKVVKDYNPSFITLFNNPSKYLSNTPSNNLGNRHAPPKVNNILRYRPGQIIAFEDDMIDYLYEIVTGTVKTYKILNDGRRLITGFYTPGDIIGLPTEGVYFHTAEALTETTVCCYRKTQIEKLMDSNANLSRKIFKMTYHRLRDAYEQMVSLGRKKPDERIAAFLLNCQKWATVQIPSQNIIITLPMSRLDIADYLGLTQETVCRVLSKFKRAGLISLLRPDQIILINSSKLSRLANLSVANLSA